ncbi:MAG TPA: LPXTG cell wall anchor domain-containing protein, partial [Nakamurella sp.]
TVNLSGHGLLMQLTVTLNGHDVTLSSDHVVRVPQEGALRVAIRGFKPGTPATVWGFSTPTILTRLTIAADRSGVQAFTLPASMLPGPHTLVVAGTSAEGKPATMSVGILVTAPSAASAVTQGAGLVAPAAGASWWWLLVVAAVLGFGFFLLVWRRRKKDDEESVAA